MHLDAHRRRDRRTSRAFRHVALIETEALESRQLLSTSTVDLSSLTAVPAISSAASAATISGLTPSQIKSAYNFSTSSTAGSGETIAIVDAYNDPNIAKDLAAFSTQFGLPAANLSVVNENGGSSLPAANAGWAEEIALDVEWAHAAAPGAKIVLVEASSASLSDLITAVKTASKSANVVSMSWGGSEFFGETQYDSVFNVPGVTFVASAGDSPGTTWPSVSPNVVGVGGTTLTLSGSGGYGSESVWNSTGGGLSYFEAQPSYQATYSGLLGVGARATPDVGYDANPSSGVAVLDTYQNSYSASGWFQVGGTSAGAPQWAGIFATADALRPAGSALSSSSALAAIYSLANNKSTAASDLHSVTAGDWYFLNTSNGVTFSLGAGVGTPNVTNLVAALAGATTTTTTTTTTTGTTGSGTTGTGSTGGGTTGGGSTGGGRHHGFSEPNTTATVVTMSPVTTPTSTLAGSLGAVTNATTTNTTASATSAQAASTTTASSAPSAARPVQPTVSTEPRSLGNSSDDQSQAEEKAVTEAGAAKDEAAQPVAPAVAPKNDAAPEENAPKNDTDPATKPDDKAPMETPLALDSWDDVLAGFGDGASLIPMPVEPATDSSGSQINAGHESAVAAGAAVFLWGSWEVRSRLNGRRAGRTFLRKQSAR
ncbi:MAG: S53 family peptidase [Isosphaeraceae bacterium]|nr:S53 family peptidase [Isosphaeraceae bacterium]